MVVYSVGCAPRLHVCRRTLAALAAAGCWTWTGQDLPIRRKTGGRKSRDATVVTSYECDPQSRQALALFKQTFYLVNFSLDKILSACLNSTLALTQVL